MCGILAIAGKKTETVDIKEAVDSLSKRGPDDHGALFFPRCTLAQTRLSIIDLSEKGHQPMYDRTKNFAITFNGEIYNYKELRHDLEKKGYAFDSESDTEVILKMYMEYGKDCPQYLDGMFAFSIWNERDQKLFMARDRFGKKPLYYHIANNGVLTVASEMKAIFATGIRGDIDPKGIDAYLSLMYVPAWRTIYKNIHVLLPAHYAEYSGKNISIKKYWDLPHKPLTISYHDAKEETRRLLTQAVKKRMLAADVEVGAFLSGGVDSTLITAYAQNFLNHPIKTFAFGYGEHINELPFAKKAAEVIGTEHQVLEAGVDAFEELETVLAYLDEPHGDSSDFPQHLLSERTSQHVKVALTGDGGDELFLGYGWYFAYWNRPKLIRLKNMLSSNPYKEHLRNITIFSEKERCSLWKSPESINTEPIDRLVSDFTGDGIQKMNRFDISTYLPGQLLVKADQMSMMHGLELRSPFLDYQLAEFAINLPEEYKMNHATGKIILKDLLEEIMPYEFVHRKKQGFGAPVRKWLLDNRGRVYVKKNLADDARIFTYLNKQKIQEHIEKTYKYQHPKSFYQIWVLLCLEIWLRQHELAYNP